MGNVLVTSWNPPKYFYQCVVVPVRTRFILGLQSKLIIKSSYSILKGISRICPLTLIGKFVLQALDISQVRL